MGLTLISAGLLSVDGEARVEIRWGEKRREKKSDIERGDGSGRVEAFYSYEERISFWR